MNTQAMGRMVRKSAAVALYMLGAVNRAAESVRLYNELQRLDDDELAALGIPRERIGRHVAESMDPVTLQSIGGSHPAAAQTLPKEALANAGLQRRAA
ncbi:MAG: hypothetical protein IH626_07405 [Rhodospirillales bacterium]|nr:hypothetical protein [Rhodospirillales bacterium]